MDLCEFIFISLRPWRRHVQSNEFQSLISRLGRAPTVVLSYMIAEIKAMLLCVDPFRKALAFLYCLIEVK